MAYGTLPPFVCYVQFGRRPSPTSVQQVLAEGPRPSIKERRYPRYAGIPDSAARRHEVVALHAEGWNPTNIAGYLDISRVTVYDVLRRWKAEGVDGLADKSRANTRKRVVDVALKQEVRKLQENPELGAFRIHAALHQMGIHVSPTTCGRILAENRQLYGLGKPAQAPKEPKEHPHKAHYRHHIWSVDLRYIEHHQIPGFKKPFYILSILDNFTRAILASNVCQRQDELSFLLVWSRGYSSARIARHPGQQQWQNLHLQASQVHLRTAGHPEEGDSQKASMGKFDRVEF